MTIRRLRLIAFAGFLLLIAASVSVTLWALRAQQDDGLVINLAGRQRMLIQQMTLETLGMQTGANPVYRQTLPETADTFEQTLTALMAGGQAPYAEGTTVALPATPASEAQILAQLETVRATWNEMHPAIHAVLQNDPQSAAFAEAAATVERLSPGLLAQMDEAVRLYEIEARRKVAFVRAVQLGFLAAAALLLVAAFAITERRILGPIALLGDAARRIGTGDLETPVSVTGLGELDWLARSLDEMRRRFGVGAEAQAALLGLSRRLLAAQDEHAVAECAVEVAASALRAEFSALVLPDAEGRLLTRAVRGWPADFAGRFELGRADASQTGYTILHGHPVAVGDYSTEMAFTVPPVVFEHGIVSGLSVPMFLEGRVVGAILVHSRTRRRFGDDESRLLSLIANQTAVALEKVRLLGAEARRAQEAETLRQAGAAVVATLQSGETIARILEQLMHVVPYDSASVLLWTEAQDRPGEGYLEIVGGRGWPDPAVVVGLRFPVPGDNPNTVVIRQRRPHILGDAPAAHAPFREDPHSHIRSWLGIPLVVRERVIGMLAIDSTEPNHFTPDHARLANAFADQVAIAVENARLYAQAERHAEQLRALRKAGHALTSELDLNAVLQTLVETARRLAAAHYAALAVLNEAGRLAFFYTAGISEAERQQIGDPPQGRGLLGVLLREGAPVRVADLARDPRAIGFPPHHPPMKSFLGVPIVARGQVLGSLYLTDKADGQPFTQEDEDLVVGLAADAAIAIQNARLFGEVEVLAATDSLTGLYNRRHFFELAEREFGRARRYGRPLSVILLDIDRFKRVNDRYSHAVGDEVLRIIAARCRSRLREIDILGRYGGEEFVVLLPENDLGGARAAAERLRRCVAETPIDTSRGALKITLSLGLAAMNADCPDLAALLSRADAAMYRAKAAGRNRLSD